MNRNKYRTTSQKVKRLIALTLGFLVVIAGFLSYQILEPSWSGSALVSAAEINTIRDSITLKVNHARIQNDQPQLIQNIQLQNAAQAKADNMVKEGYFSHVRPDGYKWSNFIDSSGYNYRYAGENLAKGYTSVDAMVISWMNSESHKENILNKDYIDTGVGFAFQNTESGKILYVVQMFGATY